MSEQAPKRYDDGQPPDPREAELVEEMTLDAMEWIHGPGSEKIVKAIRDSTDTTKTLATIAYKAVRTAAENRKATARVEMDMDMMMGVATETIDMVTEVAQAAGQVPAGSDVNTMKEDTLLKLTVMHGSTLDRTPEQRQKAMVDLRDYVASPGAQKAMDYVNNRAKKEGLNPQDMVRAGNEMLYGSPRPVEDRLQAGIRQGLMNQQKPPTPPPPQEEDPGAVMDEIYGGPVPPLPQAQPQPEAQPQPQLMAQAAPPQQPVVDDGAVYDELYGQ